MGKITIKKPSATKTLFKPPQVTQPTIRPLRSLASGYKGKKWTPPVKSGLIAGVPSGRVSEILQFEDVIGSLDDPGDWQDFNGGGGGGGFGEIIDDTQEKSPWLMYALVGAIGIVVFQILRKK